jgi:hypothetical protein
VQLASVLLQVPIAIWHCASFGVMQGTEPPAVQMPALHVSFCVQALLSALQAVPSALVGLEQFPEVPSH